MCSRSSTRGPRALCSREGKFAVFLRLPMEHICLCFCVMAARWETGSLSWADWCVGGTGGSAGVPGVGGYPGFGGRDWGMGVGGVGGAREVWGCLVRQGGTCGWFVSGLGEGFGFEGAFALARDLPATVLLLLDMNDMG